MDIWANVYFCAMLCVMQTLYLVHIFLTNTSCMQPAKENCVLNHFPELCKIIPDLATNLRRENWEDSRCWALQVETELRGELCEPKDVTNNHKRIIKFNLWSENIWYHVTNLWSETLAIRPFTKPSFYNENILIEDVPRREQTTSPWGCRGRCFPGCLRLGGNTVYWTSHSATGMDI